MDIRRDIYPTADPYDLRENPGPNRQFEVVVTEDDDGARIELWACDSNGDRRGVLYRASLEVWTWQTLMWNDPRMNVSPHITDVEYKPDGEAIYKGRWFGG